MKPRVDRLFACLPLPALLLGIGACTQPASSTDKTDTTIETPGLDQGTLLSAFFGLDDALPVVAHRICLGGAGLDGMPVITSSEVDHTTLQAGDFRVLKASGEEGGIHCVSLLPATDAGELRTILLIGEFGNDGDDPPARVEIVGNLLSQDGALNFKGAGVDVTPLRDGPFLVDAEIVSSDEKDMELGLSITQGIPCPSQGVEQKLRVIWAGGVTYPGGNAPAQEAAELYTVTVRSADGETREVSPVALGDVNDPDNNHVLCLDTPDEPLMVAFPAGHFTDPNEDLNLATEVKVKG